MNPNPRSRFHDTMFPVFIFQSFPSRQFRASSLWPDVTFFVRMAGEPEGRLKAERWVNANTKLIRPVSRTGRAAMLRLSRVLSPQLPCSFCARRGVFPECQYQVQVRTPSHVQVDNSYSRV